MKKKLFLINNMKKNSPIKVVLISFVMLLSACVPQRKYQELTNKFDVLKTQNDTLKANLESADQKNQLLTKRSEEIEKEFFRVKTDLEETEALYAKVRKSYEQLESNYKKIIDASANSQADLMSQLKELERKLQKREEELDAKEALISKNTTANTNLMQELMVLDKAIKAREAKVLELQRLLSQKDSATNRLKKTLSESLFSYKNNGITVRQFQSGRTDVDKAGKDALLKLCETLRNENDFDIVVEGHTDDVPIKTAKFEDNWDLSVLRSTSVLRIMVNDGKIDPLKIIPSGRGEYQPIDVAKTKEARAKNRRIEIILTPNLGEVLKILEK
jgi:chemotaxis protein MotB